MMTETAHAVEQITVGPMEPRERQQVIDLLARALRDNPSTVAMYGGDPSRRLHAARAVYAMLFAGLEQPPLVARSGSRLAGAAAVSPPGTCFYQRAGAGAGRVHVVVPWRQLFGLLRIGLPALRRAGTFARCAGIHDEGSIHWHVELLGVESDLRGQGIGGTLMAEVLRQADASGEPVYLETDTPRNVEFYRRLGFEVVAQDEVLGVQVWYMQRTPGHSAEITS
jgi:ribosomal protein S18 acetylase RimI-like enzyme